MKSLVHFDVEGLNGYINLSISFRSQLVLLYGLNGSGKTSAMKLISFLSSGNIRGLTCSIFDNARLLAEDMKGNEMGRPRKVKPKNWPDIYEKCISGFLSKNEASKLLSISPKTLNRWLKEEKIRNN
ncbi:AAA family ATPase [Gordonibacter sp. RACS_AR68]|uniref:AAA family ATPase n=1 Tax=Gordonibacter sp. RACS_AR68 TaxID=2872005 RepID=UPI00260E3C12|nr:AAA family ATPase [Gordonibacter sp. RACS_AR68]MDN4471354.1 AAA family ATPase [Gordonibacter sp. RACS_AR68]